LQQIKFKISLVEKGISMFQGPGVYRLNPCIFSVKFLASEVLKEGNKEHSAAQKSNIYQQQRVLEELSNSISGTFICLTESSRPSCFRNAELHHPDTCPVTVAGS
jgi:hypothetical protein